MIISCEKCNKKFEIDDALIPASGRTLQCGSCNHKWFFKKENEEKLKNLESQKIPEITSKIIDEAENVVKKEKKIIKKNEAENVVQKEKKIFKKKEPVNILKMLIVFIISLASLIILVDTFKDFIKIFIPGIDKILNSLYEIFKDIMLFLTDLIK
tara:strand:- start:548 stop:1012 length:465 start_codon:yes stop_codon:yes gene_type:complete